MYYCPDIRLYIDKDRCTVVDNSEKIIKFSLTPRFEGALQEVSFLSYFDHDVEVYDVKRVTPDAAYALGTMLSGGVVEGGAFSCTFLDASIKDSFARYIVSEFGCVVAKFSTTLLARSASLVNYIKACNIFSETLVPDVIKKSTVKHKRAFFRGFFDNMGTANVSKGFAIRLQPKQRCLELQDLLMDCGIIAKFEPSVGIEMRGREALTYIKLIGTSNKQFSQVAKDIAELFGNIRRRALRWGEIPNAKTIAENLLIEIQGAIDTRNKAHIYLKRVERGRDKLKVCKIPYLMQHIPDLATYSHGATLVHYHENNIKFAKVAEL